MYRKLLPHTFLLLLIFFVQIQLGCAQNISREHLLEDVRQLAYYLESAHPDPYINGGGKIAFHRRMQNILRAIPDEGMVKTEFYRLVCPLVANIGDGHTSLNVPYRLSRFSPGGIPLGFRVVENFLYVKYISDEKYRKFVGSRLISVEEISTGELLRRFKNQRGCDSEYQALTQLPDYLWHRDYLEQLLPEWKGKDKLRIKIQKPDNKEIMMEFSVPERIRYPLKTAETKIILPSVEKRYFEYKFTGPDKKTVLLRIDNMYTFRESFEYDEAAGHKRRTNLARRLYRKFNNKTVPENYEEVLAGIPSATDFFTDLVKEMKIHNTENLLIDMRRNRGGYSLMSDYLFYFLYGKEKYHSHKQKESSYEIKKYSALYFKNKKKMNIQDINSGRSLPLKDDDYDFRYDYEIRRPGKNKKSGFNRTEFFKKTPTFFKEYESGTFGGYYKPDNVVVISSPVTYSSGYGLMFDQYKAGAVLVGRASAQAGNGFGDILHFDLKYSGFKGTISQDYIVHFPEDPVKGEVFRPEYEMTYEKLKSFDFDPNAEILYAMEILSGNN